MGKIQVLPLRLPCNPTRLDLPSLNQIAMGLNCSVWRWLMCLVLLV